MPRTARALLLVVPLLLTVVGVGPANALGARVSLPRFEAARCPFALGSGEVQGKTVRCGYVVVPEDRARPGGPQVRLAVAIFKSQVAAPAPDPVIFLQGGPGGAILSELGPLITRDTSSFWLGDRDLILLDQRGNGYSQPSLACDELIAEKYKYLGQNVSNARQIALQAQAAQQCHDRLTREGINLDDFTTIADAADVADVRRALGYKSINIYGVSYGTRVALTVMRADPAGVRSVVLDSTFPPQVVGYDSDVTSGERAFTQLFAGCAGDAACHHAYPHLQSDFYALVDRLDAHPVTISSTAFGTNRSYRVFMNGDGLVNALFQAMYVTQFIPALPQMIEQARHGSYRLLSSIYGETGFDDSINLGTYYAVQCGEDAPFVTTTHIDALARALPRQVRPSQVTNIVGDLVICKSWGARTVPRVQKMPVYSAIPTLVLSGQYDPITPPTSGRLAASTLRHGYFFEFPGIGHGVELSSLCPHAMTQLFLDDPSAQPDASCIAAMRGPAFQVPGHGG